MSEDRYFIYKHTSPSGKVYIGKTKQKDPKLRWLSGHGYESNKYFSNAIKKYGWRNFKHEVLARDLTEEQAYWNEIFFIDMFDSFNRKHGYNLTKGGDGSLGRPLTEEHKRKLREATKAKCTGLYLGEKSVRARGCVQYDLDGYLIKEWGSISDAARALGVHYSNILKACSGDLATASGYLWTYADEKYLLPYRVQETHKITHWVGYKKGERKVYYEYY